MTNRVITFTIDLASFELQMCNLDIWLVCESRSWGQWRSKFEEVVGRRYHMHRHAAKESCASHKGGQEGFPIDRDIYIFVKSRREHVPNVFSNEDIAKRKPHRRFLSGSFLHVT